MAIETVAIRPIMNDSPRISFSSSDFLDQANFISINPHREITDKNRAHAASDFEFLATSAASGAPMLSADELIFDGKLLPFLQTQQAEKLNKVTLQPKDVEPDRRVTITISNNEKEENRVTWFVDEDPSPRPPKCTVLWKELLRLKKQRPSSSLSPSSSSSSLADVATEEEKKSAGGNKEKHQQSKRIKKGLERTRSGTIRIRPMINVPICTQTKTSSLPPMFPLRKNRVLER